MRNATLVREHEEKMARIQGVLRGDEPSIVYQPIYSLAPRRMVGLECLSRFSSTPARAPSQWFADAVEIGMAVPLELKAIRKALAEMSVGRDFYLAVNASPETILSGELEAVFADVETDRIVLEITESACVSNYEKLIQALEPLRSRSVRIAVDDVGAGFANMQHIINLHPEFIKLDSSLIRGIDTDARRRALVAAMVSFATETGSQIVAEGVETAEELDVLKSLGVTSAQGYFLARPVRAAIAARLL
ncbi:EAL domain-containing protein (putative c-di-GMP-specific phosphodiesterase class I) [Paraburkholderia sp. RAU2J]|uniref:EAL domain-containing protein n=1 Tax=Paraburkholderia sp. RAU2J TaxID=1938810 RepID=UPI000EAF887C|nr:EAL domain-containing protein [Paraburkholderia sp. RAU2J]RKT10710.1 EAL domain-containing protein (putative c-di-GMP-specific phosphodiesterase class I) [Paraburkholderia sp. RAU2J]